MATRPVFLPVASEPSRRQVDVDFTWHPGFALVHRQRSVRSLHAAAAERGIAPVLEVSTASQDELGRCLSAFNLAVEHPVAGEIPVESAFQAGKAFEGGGPYVELLDRSPREARRDPRLRNSGELLYFQHGTQRVPSQPRTLFYDWLYLAALGRLPEDLLQATERFAGFTDISFNPKRSLNCQAGSVALFVSLRRHGVASPWALEPAALAQHLDPLPPAGQQALFSS